MDFEKKFDDTGTYVKQKLNIKLNYEKRSETEEKLKPKDDRVIQIGSNIQSDPKLYDIPAGEEITDEYDNAYIRDGRLDITEKENIAKIRAKRYKNKIEAAAKENEEKEDNEIRKKTKARLKKSLEDRKE